MVVKMYNSSQLKGFVVAAYNAYVGVGLPVIYWEIYGWNVAS